MKRLLLMSIVLLLATASGAQNANSAWSEYIKARNADRSRYLADARSGYSDFLKGAWKEYPQRPPVKDPLSDDDGDAGQAFSDNHETKKGQQSKRDGLYHFGFFGMRPGVHYDHSMDLSLSGLSQDEIVRAWDIISSKPSFDTLLSDCRSIREQMRLGDWGYLQLLDSLAVSVYPESRNDSQLLLGCLVRASEYRLRMGHNDRDLVCLVGTTQELYYRQSYSFEGLHYYSLLDQIPHSLIINESSAPSSRPVDLYISSVPEISGGGRSVRHIKSHGVEMDFSIDRNLLAFYDAYPHVGWEVKASAPVSAAMSGQLYPILREKISGKSEYDALAFLQLFVGNICAYATDADFWGREKWNFPEESMIYEKGDCDDHAILFSRLVRDLLGLETVLVEMSTESGNHLSAAVKLTQPFHGETVMYSGDRYILCEPTSSFSKPGERVWRSVTIRSLAPVR